MAIIIQDDTGTVAGANAYVDIDYFDAYFAARNNEDAVDLDVEVKEAAIIEATAFIDSSNGGKFQGIRIFKVQTTQFPRLGVYDYDGYTIDGIPACLKDATCEYSIRASVSPLAPDHLYDDSGIPLKSKREKVGPIDNSFTYQEGANPLSIRRYPFADMMISKLLLPKGFLLRG